MIHEIYSQSQDSPKTNFPKSHPPGTKLLQHVEMSWWIPVGTIAVHDD